MWCTLCGVVWYGSALRAGGFARLALIQGLRSLHVAHCPLHCFFYAVLCRLCHKRLVLIYTVCKVLTLLAPVVATDARA